MKNRFLDIHQVVSEMRRETSRNIQELTILKMFVLAFMGGSFITFGALFSLLLAAEASTYGASLLLQGFGFSVGFFMVILSRSLLFSESNVVLPASLLDCSNRQLFKNVMQFWLVTIIGNIFGAVVIGYWINAAHEYPAAVMEVLEQVIHKKMYYYRGNTSEFWLMAVFSGMLGNWLVGMAAVFALMGKTIIGKYLPVFLAVTMFVAANFQHSPANLGYFSIAIYSGIGPDWGSAILWNLIPAALGNILGGIFLVALPFWYSLSHHEKAKIKK